MRQHYSLWVKPSSFFCNRLFCYHLRASLSVKFSYWKSSSHSSQWHRRSRSGVPAKSNQGQETTQFVMGKTNEDGA